MQTGGLMQRQENVHSSAVQGRPVSILLGGKLSDYYHPGGGFVRENRRLPQRFLGGRMGVDFLNMLSVSIISPGT